ncbi:ABC transporter substrate-binding protein [Parafrankia sp. EUN1f]|uniref:ABC transporter substrate-binding protein n=1 Tax=Parafrankia sp. EUN1f TaxID=102897 RepID=UPI0001C466E5|nr:ABC transporter substrate-binding protein [Parafrankia sp. EUN1f]EFC86400.1 ABC-type branched-chain amino acid transport systems periplasmic component-like protein [Parafrankia sp. EUN1f]
MQRTQHSSEPSPRRRRRSRAVHARGAVAALSALTLLLVAGCGGGDSDKPAAADAAGSGTAAAGLLGPVDPASGAPVRIGLISDGKGPVSDLSIEGAVANATVKYLNEHRGGLAGRPIELVECDALADPAKGTDCANRMVEEDVAAVLVGSSSVAEAIWEPLHEAHMPVMLAYAAGAPLKDTESTFALTDTSYTINALVQLAKSQGVKKVTIVAIDVPSTMVVLRASAPKFNAVGIELESVPVPPGTADMTPQMQGVADGKPGLVQIVGNDAFCIAAMNGLRAVAYDGAITPISNCMSDKTRKAVPGDFLEGAVVPAMAPIGADNPSTKLYNTVATTYGKGIDTGRIAGMNMFMEVAAFEAAADGVTGDITGESIIKAIRAMPETELPAGGGLKFRCNSKAFPSLPAVCVRGWLTTTLDGSGNATEYKPVNATPIES